MNDINKTQDKLFSIFGLGYRTGPWNLSKKVYNETDPIERLNSELEDLYQWIVPTKTESYLRKATAYRYIKYIENILPNSLVVVQGSSSTDTYLIDSDIDLIIFPDYTTVNSSTIDELLGCRTFKPSDISTNIISDINLNFGGLTLKDTYQSPNLKSEASINQTTLNKNSKNGNNIIRNSFNQIPKQDQDKITFTQNNTRANFNFQTNAASYPRSVNTPAKPSEIDILSYVLRKLTDSRMTNRGVLIKNARVPIAKVRDRYFDFNIDICIDSYNGVSATQKLNSIIKKYGIVFKKFLYILKIFVHTYSLDSPFKGGYGSTELVHFAMFVVMKNPNETNLAKLLLYFFDLIGNKLNFYLTGLSLENDFPHFFSKIRENVTINKYPQSLVFKDYLTEKDNYLGVRSRKTYYFSEICRSFLLNMEEINTNEKSFAFVIFTGLSSYEEVRKKQMHMFKSVYDQDFQKEKKIRINNLNIDEKFGATVEMFLDRNSIYTEIVEKAWEKLDHQNSRMNFHDISLKVTHLLEKNKLDKLSNDHKLTFEKDTAKKPPYVR